MRGGRAARRAQHERAPREREPTPSPSARHPEWSSFDDIAAAASSTKRRQAWAGSGRWRSSRLGDLLEGAGATAEQVETRSGDAPEYGRIAAEITALTIERFRDRTEAPQDAVEAVLEALRDRNRQLIGPTRWVVRARVPASETAAPPTSPGLGRTPARRWAATPPTNRRRRRRSQHPDGRDRLGL